MLARVTIPIAIGINYAIQPPFFVAYRRADEIIELRIKIIVTNQFLL